MAPSRSKVPEIIITRSCPGLESFPCVGPTHLMTVRVCTALRRSSLVASVRLLLVLKAVAQRVQLAQLQRIMRSSLRLQGDCMTWEGHVVGAEPRGSVYECFAGRSKALLRPCACAVAEEELPSLRVRVTGLSTCWCSEPPAIL